MAWLAQMLTEQGGAADIVVDLPAPRERIAPGVDVASRLRFFELPSDSARKIAHEPYSEDAVSSLPKASVSLERLYQGWGATLGLRNDARWSG